jgi:hypothetical protein
MTVQNINAITLNPRSRLDVVLGIRIGGLCVHRARKEIFTFRSTAPLRAVSVLSKHDQLGLGDRATVGTRQRCRWLWDGRRRRFLRITFVPGFE